MKKRMFIFSGLFLVLFSITYYAFFDKYATFDTRKEICLINESGETRKVEIEFFASRKKIFGLPIGQHQQTNYNLRNTEKFCIYPKTKIEIRIFDANGNIVKLVINKKVKPSTEARINKFGATIESSWEIKDPKQANKE